MKSLAAPILLIALGTCSSGVFAEEQKMSSNADAKLSAKISHETLRSVTRGADDRFTGTARITSLFYADTPSRVTGG